MRHGLRQRNRFLLASLGLAVGLMGLLSQLVGASVSSATTASSVERSSAIKPDLSFFNGKTVNVYVTAGPGNPQSATALALQGPLGQYLHATFNMQYSSANTNIFLDATGDANPDGLTIGLTNIKSIISNIYENQGTNFPILPASFIGSAFAQPSLVVACANSPFTSFAQVVKTSKQIPIVGSPPGGVALQDHLLTSIYSFPHTYLTGYTGTTLAAGCERGDGQISLTSASSFTNAAETAMVPGLTPLLLMGPEPKGSPLAFLNKETPTLANFVAKHPLKTPASKEALKLMVSLTSSTAPQYVMFGPRGIPKNRLLALQDAFAAVMKQAGVKQALLDQGIPPGFVTPKTIHTDLELAIKKQTLVQRFLNS